MAALTSRAASEVVVNLGLEEDVDQIVRSINTELVTTGMASEVVFGKEPSGPFPHITLLMGTVRGDRNVNLLWDRVAQVSASVLPIRFQVERPRVEGESAEWVFMDVESSSLDSLRFRLASLCGELMDLHRYGSPGNPGHITVGRSSERIDSAALDRLASVRGVSQTPLQSVALEIRISEKGSSGTCGRTLTSSRFEGFRRSHLG